MLQRRLRELLPKLPEVTTELALRKLEEPKTSKRFSMPFMAF